MVFNFKRVTCSLVTLLVLCVCSSVGYSQQISRTVSYKAIYQPFGAGIHKEYSLPAEVDPEKHLQLHFVFSVRPEDISANLQGALTLDPEQGTLQIRGTDGSLTSEGGLVIEAVIKVAFEIASIPFVTKEPIQIKTELPIFSADSLDDKLTNIIGEARSGSNGASGTPGKKPRLSGLISLKTNLVDAWYGTESFNSLLLEDSTTANVRGGIRDMVRAELTAVDIVELIIVAVSSGTVPPNVANVLGIIIEAGVGNAGISCNLGFLSTATLTGKSVLLNGQRITSENQMIPAPRLDRSQNNYTVNSSYEEQFTYQLDFVISSDIWLDFNPLGIPVWSYPKTVVAEYPQPLIPKREVDLDFTSVQTRFPMGGPQDNRPVPVGIPPPQTLTLHGRSMSVDMAPYFSSPSRLIYDVSSSPSGFVSTRRSGSRVTITPQQTGSASVVVTARDSTHHDLDAIQTIPVTVRAARPPNVSERSDAFFTLSTGSTEWQRGTRVITIGSPPLDIRRDPWVSNLIGRARDGANGTITDGPRENGGATWWKIDWDHGGEGWSVEVFRGTQRLFRHPPDLEIQRLDVPKVVDPGERFEIDVRIRNNGPGESDPTQLHLFYSPNSRSTFSKFLNERDRDARVAGQGPLEVRALDEDESYAVSLWVEAPTVPNTYYYGAVFPTNVDPRRDHVSARALNNNYEQERVEVLGSPDLIVESISADTSTLAPGETFDLEVVIGNQGIGTPERNAKLYYYLSSDLGISKGEKVGRDVSEKRNLNPGGSDRESISLEAPTEPGVYYYRVCIDAAAHESDTGNNCSGAVAITVREPGVPDLVVSTPTLSASEVAPGQSVTLTATVENRSTGTAPTTRLRVYRSSNPDISDVDTEVRAVPLKVLEARATHTAQIGDIEVPLAAGTYYYGVCVDGVAKESNTVNNCSTGVALTVENLAPTVAGTLPAQTLFVGTVATVDLTPYFSDPNADRLTYTPGSNAPGSVAVELSGASESDLQLSPLATGTVQVTVEATDPNGLTATQVFSVTVNPQPNRAPVSVSAISAQTLPIEGAPRVVDVSSLFHDSDGDLLHYTAGSDNTNVVSVNLSGPQVTLIPEAEGSAVVSVTASDGELSATLSILIAVTGDISEVPRLPDLRVDEVGVSKTKVKPGETFQMEGTVWNGGKLASSETTLRYYLSTDETISPEDMEIDTAYVATLSGKGAHASRRRAEMSKTLTAPDTPGVYYYGVCVDAVAGDADITNNCSQAVAITVEAPPEPVVAPVPGESGDPETGEISGPDLIFSMTRVDASTIKVFAGVRFHITLTNQGTEMAAATMIRYYRSEDATISAEDTELRAVPIGQLGAGRSQTTWALLPGSVSVGTYYYGACVDGVDSEFDTTNNCSDAIEITVERQGEGTPQLSPIGTISTQELEVGGSPVVLNISGYFFGEEVESYTVSSNKTEVVTVSMSDSEVTLTPVGKGWATVTVTAISGDLAAKHTFSVSVGGAAVPDTQEPDLSPEVSIPDANLRQAIRSALGLEEGDTLTQQKIQKLTGLNVFDKGMTDLSGLQHATNLTKLELAANSISDISPLASLTALRELDLSINNISDISLLASLTALTKLDLASNNISDISPLVSLTALTYLDLSGNSISNISSLASLTVLTYLDLSGNSISDISSLASLTALTKLYLSANSISDISPLSSLTALTDLILSGNSISDISPLASLTVLRFLDVSDLTSLTDITPLHSLTTLQWLYFSGDMTLDENSVNTIIDNNPGLRGGDGIVVILADAPPAPLLMVEPSAPVLPNETALLSNYPNPFNPETWIPYQLAKAADVTLTIYDLRGVVVRRLVLGHQPAGFYRSRGRAAHWDGRNALSEKVASGLYFYTFTAGDFTATQKLLILK